MGGRQQAVLRDCLTEAGRAQVKGGGHRSLKREWVRSKSGDTPPILPPLPVSVLERTGQWGPTPPPLHEDCQRQKLVSSPRRISSCLEHSKGPGPGQGWCSVLRLRAGGGLQRLATVCKGPAKLGTTRCDYGIMYRNTACEGGDPHLPHTPLP